MADEPLFESEEAGDGSFFYALTEQGLETIANWCRFRMELRRMAPNQYINEAGEVEEEQQLALLVWFLVREAYEFRGIEMKGIETGALFPKDWDDENE